MKKVLTGAVSIAMAATMLAGCGGSDSNSNTVRVAVGGDINTLDPAKVDASIDANIINNMYDGLYKLDSDGNTIPVLATDMPEISDDGLTYTIKFTEDAKWSDGEPLTADDFIYSWKRGAALGTANAYYSMFITKYISGAIDGSGDPNAFDNMTDFGAVALDDHTIQITLKDRVPFFTSVLVSNAFYPLREDIVGEDPLDDSWAKGTDYPVVGAFVPTKVDYAAGVSLTKNENYYLADEVKLDGIEYTVMTDQDSEVSAFKSGQLDLATSVNPETVYADDELKESIYTIDPFVCNYYILFNCGDENDQSTEGLKALKDVDIRHAISWAINREEVAAASGYGDAAYPLYGYVPSGIPGAHGDFREETGDETKYDLEAAKKIMEDKGYSADNMLTLEYKYNDTAMHKNIAQVLQANLKEIYIDLKCTSTEKSTFFDARDKGDGETFRHAMSADYFDPMTYLEMLYGKDTAGNLTDDATYESMLDAANAESDPTKRLEMLGDAERYLVEDQAYIAPLIGYSDPYLLNTNLKGLVSSPEGHYDLTRAYFE
ncbi:peptide ABC transporter substrate-binding protein [Floccifex sp.]|uniref:peptide ABC transporter substrate-binding protein n=1 Tax=Floccifex sp. TaxID=2815810 RepID=UPI0029FEC89E|nr:ABC transporter substrate-binding protein [Floccifex sp.]MDD7281147.1 peptide ABC transporter substrate-binding protein [Erysipelotrichaceae bacterium]MDY2958053.1 peptide ABC transporter substrate-binding protein [Floccifex sp.]